MIFRMLLATAAGLVLALNLAATNDDPKNDAAPFDPTDRYEAQTLEGWPILVHRDLLEKDAELGARVLRHLSQQLYQVKHRLPEDVVAKLQQIKIWVELNEPHHPGACYHPDVGWLRNNGMNPDKARCVELANAENFLSWTMQQPWMVLHELAHAYHHQFLDGSFENQELAAALEEAKRAGKYESVRHINGSEQRHYALTNQQEYFAEATEAFFGTNDFYPFVRAELQEHDPRLFELLGRLWGTK